MKMNRLTTQIGIAMLLGVIVGYLCNTQAASPAAAKPAVPATPAVPAPPEQK